MFVSYGAFYPNNEFPSGLADAVAPNKFVLVAGEEAGADYSLGFPPNKHLVYQNLQVYKVHQRLEALSFLQA